MPNSFDPGLIITFETMRAVLSIIVATQILLSSMSFQLGLHLCGESIRSIALYDKATPCNHALLEETPSCHHSDVKEEGSNCCSDEMIVVEGEDYQFISEKMEYSHTQWVMAVTFLPTPIHIILPGRQTLKPYLNLKPPLIKEDLNLHYRRFLI